MGTSGEMSTSNQYVKYQIIITQNWQDIAGNFSNVTISVRFYRTNTGYETYGNGAVYCRINGGFHSAAVSSSQRITSAGIVLFSETHNIPHNADGSKYLDTSAWIDIPSVVTSNEQGYGEWLSNIPRNATCTDATNFNDEQNPIVYFNNPGNFDLYLKMEAGGDDYLIKRDKATRASPYTFILTETEKNLLRAKCPNSNTLTVRFTVGTYINGSIAGWSYVDRMMSIVNANPTFNSSQLTYKDTASAVVSITGNNQHIVRNQSNMQATYTVATALKYATISKYQITFNGTTQEKAVASTINYGLVNSAQNLTLQVKAIDSRGNNTTISKTVIIFDWVPPIITATAIRVNNFENQTNLLANIKISSVNSKNGIQTLQYRTKKTSTSTWSSWINFQNNKQTPINLDNLFAWDLEVQTTDKFGVTTNSLVVPKGMPIAFFDTGKISVGINKFPVNNNSLDVDVLNGKLILDYVVISEWDDSPKYTIDFNDTYYFIHNNGIFTSNNQGIHSTTAYTRLKIDTTNRASDILIKVDYTISSEANYDFGYVTANNSATFVPYNTTAGRFIYVSGATTTSSATYTLTKGQVWYIHLGYRKDGSANANNDTFIISKITLT